MAVGLHLLLDIVNIHTTCIVVLARTQPWLTDKSFQTAALQPSNSLYPHCDILAYLLDSVETV